MEKLVRVGGIGEKTARSIMDLLSDVDNIIILEKLQTNTEYACLQDTLTSKMFRDALTEKTFPRTGTLASLAPAQARQIIEANGGTVSGSRSKLERAPDLTENPLQKSERTQGNSESARNPI
jgi:NAD-dependent DNA ligase